MATQAKAERALIPEEAITFNHVVGPVVYFLMQGQECVYVGATKTLGIRIDQHFNGTAKHKPKVFDSVRYIHVESSMLLETERYWINALEPVLNINSGKVPMSFRVSPELRKRMKEAAADLGIEDESALMRLLINEFLPVYEERAREYATA